MNRTLHAIRVTALYAVMAWACSGGHAIAGTYYISSVSGSDANTSAQAQSKSTPWAHLPCMAGATSNADSYTPVAGDIFILKGGETWGNASFPCNWAWSGTVSNPFLITVDPTWFAGASWSRPKWDAEGIAISGARNMFLWFNLSANKYITFSNIEMTGFRWDGAPSFGTCAHIMGAAASFITLDNLYIHGWAHGTAGSGTTDASCRILLGDSNPPNMEGSVLQNSIIDGSDSTGGGDSGSNYLWSSFKNNVMHDFPNAMIVKGAGEISGNTVYNCRLPFDGINHPNLFESLGATTAHTLYFHDNVFHDYEAGCESAFFAGQNATVYAWNNIWYNNNGANTPTIDHVGAAPPNVYFWNNTIVAPTGRYCMYKGHTGGTPAIIEIQKNHCITTLASAFDPNIAATSLTIANNVLQTPSAAATDGYSSSSLYPYAPQSASMETVTIGGTITIPACAGVLTSLCEDTSFGSVVVGSSVSGYGRIPSLRQIGASRNAGAYEWGVSKIGGMDLGSIDGKSGRGLQLTQR